MIERRILLKGFLRNKVNFVLNEDLFMSHHYNVYIEKYSKRPIKAYEVDLKNKRQHILSTIGEYLERETLINENSPKEHTVIATNLIDGSIKQVNLDMILFKNSFVDSSGMASHKKSKPLIWTAYKEFFERQSYITNFLFHTKAQQLNIDKIEEIKKIDRYLTNYLDNVKYYNISLSKNLYVVLAVGYGEKYKAVGLGTSQSARKAVIKSQKEILQYFATSYSKYKEGQVSQRSEVVIDNKDIYHDYFDRLRPEEVKEL
ncbi:YcaO-like family protein, partial [Enterococcus faecalis]|nr:YcaO-like family protein [Enterococcus faecalis]